MAYIKIEKAIAEIDKGDLLVGNNAEWAKEILFRTPTADVEVVKHGHWIEDGEYQICSVCGEEHHWDEYRATYCEDCGAKMDGGKAE